MVSKTNRDKCHNIAANEEEFEMMTDDFENGVDNCVDEDVDVKMGNLFYTQSEP